MLVGILACECQRLHTSHCSTEPVLTATYMGMLMAKRLPPAPRCTQEYGTPAWKSALLTIYVSPRIGGQQEGDVANIGEPQPEEAPGRGNWDGSVELGAHDALLPAHSGIDQAPRHPRSAAQPLPLLDALSLPPVPQAWWWRACW